MRRGLIALVAFAAAAGLSGGVVSARPAGRPPGRLRPVPPARMLVYAQEYSLWPSRSSLPAGRVTVQLSNRGMDAHDLRIRRLNAAGTMVGASQGVAIAQSGQLRQATWRLRAGSYELYCSMPGHLARGMHVRLRVRAAR